MNTQNDRNRDDNAARDEKKQYARPELLKHGNVESLTQVPYIPNPSNPA